MLELIYNLYAPKEIKKNQKKEEDRSLQQKVFIEVHEDGVGGIHIQFDLKGICRGAQGKNWGNSNSN